MAYKILGTPKTLDQLKALTPPSHTSTWRPLGFHAVITFLLGLFDRAGLTVEEADYGVNKTEKRMIAMFRFATPAPVNGVVAPTSGMFPSLMVRGAYDMAWAWNLLLGSGLSVCQNGIFDGQGLRVLSRNTLNVWDTFSGLASRAVSDVIPTYHRNMLAASQLADVACGERRGAGLIGVARYNGVLSATQESVVIEDWRKARHPEFARRDLWGLYNAGTEGLKKGSIDNAGERHIGWHKFLTDFAASERARAERAARIIDVG